LDRISSIVRQNIEQHELSLQQFRERLSKLGGRETESDLNQLCKIADELLRPTMYLANQLARCHDELQLQGGKLMTFADVRTDPLTSLGNRRALDEALTGQFALRARYGQQFSLAVFDIDHFKSVNDTHGHLAGDAILKQVARLLESSVREIDFVARYGGEEFVLLMPQTDLDGAALLAERLRAKVAQETQATISGGVAMAMDGENDSDLLSRADAAMYQAKEAGRNCVYLHRVDKMQPIAVSTNLATLPATIGCCA
jgi:diguanylate cyclase (GGDEF)-like protein